MRKLLLITVLSGLMVFVAACGSSSDSSEEDKGNASGEAEKVTVNHELGETDVPKTRRK